MLLCRSKAFLPNNYCGCAWSVSVCLSLTHSKCNSRELTLLSFVMPSTTPVLLLGGAQHLRVLRNADTKYKDDPITLSATAFHSANAHKLRASVAACMRPHRECI